MNNTVWIRTAIVREEDKPSRCPLSGYPSNYDRENPDRRYFTKRVKSIVFIAEEYAVKPLENEIRLVSMVEVDGDLVD